MRPKFLPPTTLAVLAALALPPAAGADPAPEAAKPTRHCFWPSQVSGFNSVDDRTVRVTVGVRDVYELALMAPCPDVDWAHSIALVARGGSTICSGLDAEVIAPSPIGPRSCPVSTVRKLTPEEVKATAKAKKR